jgi:TolA-binding protein
VIYHVTISLRRWISCLRRRGAVCVALLPLLLGAAGCQTTLDDASIKDIYGPAGRTARHLAEDQKARDRRLPPEGSDEFDTAKLLYDEEKYSEALASFKALVKKYKDKPIEEESQFMVAECHFQMNRYPAAQDAYAELLKKFPSTRHLDPTTRRLFTIARHWLKSPKPASEVELAQFTKEGAQDPSIKAADAEVPLQIPLIPNLTDPSRPVFDTEGRALEALRQIWINDPSGPLADDALMLTATHHLRKKDFREADRYFSNIRQQYATSEHASSAYVLGSYASQMSYQGPNYDGRQLEEAKKLTQSAVRLFEDLPQRDKLVEDLKRLDTQSAERDWQRVEYHMKRREKDAAAVYCECIISAYPDSPFAEKARDVLDQLGPEHAAGIIRSRPRTPAAGKTPPEKSPPEKPAPRPEPVEAPRAPARLRRNDIQPRPIDEAEEAYPEAEIEEPAPPPSPGRARMRPRRPDYEEL